jgi:hypothetical protein
MRRIDLATLRRDEPSLTAGHMLQVRCQRSAGEKVDVANVYLESMRRSVECRFAPRRVFLSSAIFANPIEVKEPLPLLYERPVERRTTSRRALVLPLFLIAILGGTVSYGYFRADWLLSETAKFLAQFLAL